jgi:organic radical activating enzyme
MATSKIKVSEIFYSLQGEGLHTGTPSLFLRTFGCNFTCSGFGMPKGQLSTERLDVDPKDFKKYEDLPLVHTGCDSYPAWDVRFKKFSPVLEVSAIVDQMQQILPDGQFGNKVDLILTGGEPLLGWQKSYPALFNEIQARGMDLRNITFETNGTQPLSDALNDALDEGYNVTFSISSKLSSSGESAEDAIKPEIVRDYLYYKDTKQRRPRIGFFKWVCTSPDDLDEVIATEKKYIEGGVYIPVYLMCAGGTDRLYHKNKQWLAKICMAHGYRYSQRLQIDLFGNQWAT